LVAIAALVQHGGSDEAVQLAVCSLAAFAALPSNAHSQQVLTTLFDDVAADGNYPVLRYMSDQASSKLMKCGCEKVKKVRVTSQAASFFAERYALQRFVAGAEAACLRTDNAVYGLRVAVVDALDETAQKVRALFLDKLPLAIIAAASATGLAHGPIVTAGESPHAKVIALSTTVLLLYDVDGRYHNVAASMPQHCFTADRCTGTTYKHLLRISRAFGKLPLAQFMRIEHVVMADRDGAVAKGARSLSLEAAAHPCAMPTCRVHPIHDIAGNSVGLHQQRLVRGTIHIQKSLSLGGDASEFRNVFRSRLNERLRFVRGPCTLAAELHRDGVFDAVFPRAHCDARMLRMLFVCRKCCNGSLTGHHVDIHILGEVDEVAARIAIVTELPDALYGRMSITTTSRWTESLKRMAAIAFGVNMNGLFQEAYPEWVELHEQVDGAPSLDALLAIADGVVDAASEGLSGATGGGEASKPKDEATAKREAQSKSRRVGHALCKTTDISFQYLSAMRCQDAQQSLVADALREGGQGHLTLEYTRAALTTAAGGWYRPRCAVERYASQVSEESYIQAAWALMEPSAWRGVAGRDRTIANNALAFRNIVGGVGVLRQTLTSLQVKPPLLTYMNAFIALDSGNFEAFGDYINGLGDLATVNEQQLIDGYGPLVGTKVAVLDQCYKALGTPSDNALLEDIHARNRRYLMKRTAVGCSLAPLTCRGAHVFGIGRTHAMCMDYPFGPTTF
jgi:hypothetical protein